MYNFVEVYVAAPSKGVSAARFVNGEQHQLLLHLADGRRLFVFHGSDNAAVNAQTLTKYKSILSQKDVVLACCHGLHMPSWVQERFVDKALLSWEPITIMHSGREGDNYVLFKA